MCQSIREGGRRCPAQLRCSLSAARQRHATAADHAAAIQNDPDASAEDITAAQQAVHSAEDAVRSAEERWFASPAGIAELERRAEDTSLPQKERTAARKLADENRAARHTALHGKRIQEERDFLLRKDLLAAGVSNADANRILAMNADSSVENLYVPASKTAVETLRRVQSDYDAMDQESRTVVAEASQKAIADARARGENLSVKQSWAVPEVASLIAEYKDRRADALDALRSAQASYYLTPQGVKELKAEWKDAEKEAREARRVLAAMGSIKKAAASKDYAPAREHARAARERYMEQFKHDAEAELQSIRDDLRRAQASGDKKRALELSALGKSRGESLEREWRVMATPQSFKEAVTARVEEIVAADRAELIENARVATEREAAARSKHNSYARLKGEATTNKALRLAREAAIREAVVKAQGDSPEAKDAAHEIVLAYRRNRRLTPTGKPLQRRAQDLDPLHVRDRLITVYATPEEAESYRKAAKDAGAPLSEWARQQFFRAPQPYFTSAPLDDAQREVNVSRDGTTGRPRTNAHAVRSERINVPVSAAERARVGMRARCFTETVSSFTNTLLRGRDARLVQRDRSQENRDRKATNSVEHHADAWMSEEFLRRSGAD